MPYKDPAEYNQYMRDYRRFEREEMRLRKWFITEMKALLEECNRKITQNSDEKYKILEQWFLPQNKRINEIYDEKERQLKIKHEIGEPQKTIRIKVK